MSARYGKFHPTHKFHFLNPDIDPQNPFDGHLASTGSQLLTSEPQPRFKISTRNYEVNPRSIASRWRHGRDVVADILAGLLGIESLPLLIAASARDLGDDQDTLQSTTLDVMGVCSSI